MANLIPASPSNSRAVRHSMKIDMTPMVDLGFLLITFFIFTATLTNPGALRLVVPKDGPPTTVAESKTLTFLLNRTTALAYEGAPEEAFKNGSVTTISYDTKTGLGQRIRQKQSEMKDPSQLVVLIKPLPQATYQRVIEALDELNINRVSKYAMVDATREENTFARR